MSFFGVGELDLMRLPTDGAKICDQGGQPAPRGGEPAAHHAAPRSPQGGVREPRPRLARRCPLRDRQGLPPHTVGARPLLPDQPDHLAFVAVGERGSSGILGARRDVDAHEATGLVRLLGEVRGLDLRVYPGENPPFHPGRAGMVLLDKEVVGWAGELHPAVSRAYGLSGRVAAGSSIWHHCWRRPVSGSYARSRPSPR